MMVEKHRSKSRLTSVTSLSHSEDDKSVREGFFLEGEKKSLIGETQSQGKAFGILVHQLLEKGWNWDKATLVKAARLWAPSMGLSGEKAVEAAELVVKAFSNDLLKRARQSSKVFKELSLTGKTSEGTYLNAVVDLAFLENDKWVVVDYKTDQDQYRGLESYRKQIGYYSGLLESFTGLKVKNSYLYFLRLDHVEPVQ